jgi:putative phosphoribosyl transferase
MKINRRLKAITVDSPVYYMRYFVNRRVAGALLAKHLSKHAMHDPVVLGIARGGVAVAAEVARGLNAELDVLIARKLGAPTSRELAIGAITAEGGFYLNKPLIRELAIPRAYVERVTELELAEAHRQARRLHFRRAPDITGRTVFLVDDGLATGATMIVAARQLREHSPERIVVAVPVGAGEACWDLRGEVDHVVCLVIPEPFWSVGLYYQNFDQLDDDDVVRLLESAREVTR